MEQQDVSEPSRPEQIETRVQLRNERRDNSEAEIERLHAERSGIAEAKDEDETPSTAPEIATTPPPDTPHPVSTPPETPAAPATPAVPEMVTVKVDGESFEVPKAEVEEAGGVRAFQTMRAADNRLKKANETLAATRQAQEQANAIARAAIAAQVPKAPEPTEDELIQAIRFGTPQEASAALRTMRGAPVDQNAIVMKAAAINNYNAARRRFGAEFQDIVANPIIRDAVLAQENRAVQGLAQNGQVDWANLSNVDFDVFFRNIGNQVRSAFGTRPSQPASVPAAPAAQTPGNPSLPSEKEARKASIVNLPTAASARATPPEEDKPETREQILNAELKARGRPPMFG
jgi:hypothetical protein